MTDVKRVLIVDDEPHIARVVGMNLERAGVVIASADDGREALRAVAEEGPFDLVITDYQMPVMDGFELACALRADASMSEVPVIMVTARGYKLTCDQLGMTNIRHMLAKPFRPRDLVELALRTIGCDGGYETEAKAA